MWIKALSVFGLGMLGLWEGVPAGFAFRFPPLAVGAIAGAGATVATLIVTLLGERVSSRLIRRKTDAEPPRRERLIDRIWRRYGIVGLGLLAPCITGGPIGMALGLFLRAPVGRLLRWMLAGILLWTLILTAAGFFGTAGLKRLFAT